jgi:two-component system, cell cycle sensor histidine kinase and response regulator CckA
MNHSKIMVVEDENIVALDLRYQLEKNGYIVSAIFSSGEEALQNIDKLKPNLVLMDIQLQGNMDGVETAKMIRDDYKIPVVFITAFADDTTFQRAKSIDPFGYIIKPFEERILRTTIEMAIYKAEIDRKLVESEERYRNFFEEDLSGDFVAKSDGTIFECNPAFLEMFEFESRERALGTAINNLFTDDEQKENFWSELRSKKKLRLMELELKTYTEEVIEVMANVIADFENGTIKEIKGYLIDTTERKKLEEQLRQSQKMEAIGRLAGGVAHDFNNILTVITGYNTMMKEKIKEDMPIEEDIEGIKKAAQKATNLTRQLLVFSRKHTLKPSVVSINTLLNDMEKMLDRLIHENITITYFLEAENPYIFIDQSQMEQVLINLAVNAKDAMPDGGKLLVQTYNYEPTARERLEMNIEQGNYVVISIQDTGVGIPEKERSKIFEPFFTTKTETQGTGLGLSTVYAIVTQSKGYIRVSSEVGKGTTFTIYLPLWEGLAGSEVEKKEDTGDTSGSETILIVEDDANVRELVYKILIKKGYHVLEAQNAGEAIIICEKQVSPIHLLITDVVMPLMRGDELAMRLKKIRPELKTLFMSGYSDKKIEAEASEADKPNFIQKPFEICQFTSMVRGILDSPS